MFYRTCRHLPPIDIAFVLLFEPLVVGHHPTLIVGHPADCFAFVVYLWCILRTVKSFARVIVNRERYFFAVTIKFGDHLLELLDLRCWLNRFKFVNEIKRLKLAGVLSSRWQRSGRRKPIFNKLECFRHYNFFNSASASAILFLSFFSSAV